MQSKKNFRTHFKRDYQLINTELINEFSSTEFPYILRLYSEPMEMLNGQIGFSVGIVICDRRNELVYPMIVMLRSKREKWLFKNL
jgi:hypothetical protein